MKVNVILCIVALMSVDATEWKESASDTTVAALTEETTRAGNATDWSSRDAANDIDAGNESKPNARNESPIESDAEADKRKSTLDVAGADPSAPSAPKGNTTLSDTTLTNSTPRIYIDCLTDRSYGVVEVVNATRLMELLKLATPVNRTEVKNDGNVPPRTCLLVLFYARWCIFSSQAAPHFNALPRFFPHIKAVAIDASKYQNFNTQFGIVGVPTLMFIYNGKPLVKFNDTSYTLEMFARFVTTYTALEANGSLYVTSADFGGPVRSTPSNETDYCLVASWIFIAACAIYFLFQSRWWRQFVELVQNTWRESNAQHEHAD